MSPKLVIIEGNSNDKDNVRAIMVKGEKGYSAYDLYVQHGGTLTEEQWLDEFLNAENFYNKSEANSLLDAKTVIYSNIASMKADTNLKAGMTVQTLGYYSVDDGGKAKYIIVDEENATEYQEELDNGLYANLIIENDEISFKQIGAIADGETDNSIVITKALSIIKAKNISNFYIDEGTFVMNNTQFIIPSGLHLYGSGKNSIIQVNSLTNEIFMTNEHYLNYDYKDTFILEDFRINKQAINTGTKGKRCMRFACTDNVVIRNVVFYSNVDSQFAVLDMYSNNSNMLVENCKAYKTNSSEGVLVGGYAIREFSSHHTTENITIKDCLIVKDGKDESLWIDSWYGIVKNIVIDNFKMIDNNTTDATNSVFFGGSRNGSALENVLITNSYFYKKDLRYRIATLCGGEIANQTRTTKNLVINNCTFEADNFIGSSATSCFIEIGGLNPTTIVDSCVIKNSTFLYNNDNNIALPCFLHGINNQKVCSENNKYYGITERAIHTIYSSKNDYIEKAPTVALFIRTPNIDNVVCDEVIPYLLIVQKDPNIRKVTIKNCSGLKCDRLLQNNTNTNGINYRIINCQIENDNDASMVTNYGQTEELMTLELLNTDIKTPVLTNNEYINLKASGLSVSGETFKGIPNNQHDRNNYPIGTVFFSDTPTKSIVRKITSGNSESNWEEI